MIGNAESRSIAIQNHPNPEALTSVFRALSEAVYRLEVVVKGDGSNYGEIEENGYAIAITQDVGEDCINVALQCLADLEDLGFNAGDDALAAEISYEAAFRKVRDRVGASRILANAA